MIPTPRHLILKIPHPKMDPKTHPAQSPVIPRISLPHQARGRILPKVFLHPLESHLIIFPPQSHPIWDSIPLSRHFYPNTVRVNSVTRLSKLNLSRILLKFLCHPRPQLFQLSIALTKKMSQVNSNWKKINETTKIRPRTIRFSKSFKIVWGTNKPLNMSCTCHFPHLKPFQEKN